MLTLLLPVVLAAHPAQAPSNELERALLADAPAPIFAARCDPLAIVATGVDSLGSLPIPLGKEAGKLDLFGTSGLTDAGFDLDSPARIEAWGKGEDEAVRLSMPFRGEIQAAHDWLQGFGDEIGPVEGDHFTVGKKNLAVSVAKGQLLFSRGELPQGPAWHPPAGLLDDVPLGGCAMLVAIPRVPGTKTEKFPSAILIHLATGEDSEALVRAALAHPAPEPLQSRGETRLHLGRSEEAPTMVMTVGVSLSAIINEILAIKDAPERFQTIQIPLSELALALDGAELELTPGASVALWRGGGLLPTGPKMKVAALVPVRRSKGGHVPAKRLMAGLKRGLEEKGMTVAEEDGHLAVDMGKSKLLLDARRDLLFIATDADLLAQARTRHKGKPWADADFADFAEEWGVAFRIQGTGTGSSQIGIRARDSLLEMSASGSGPAGPGMSGMASAMLMGALGKLGGQLDKTFQDVNPEIEDTPPIDEPQEEAPQKP